VADLEDVHDLRGDLTGGLHSDQRAGADPTATTAEDEAAEEGLDRVFTVPNVITLLRLLCIPVFLWLLFGLHEQTAAAILLAVLGATDWVDGFVARRYHQVSTIGKVLDPAADRLLVGTAVISVLVYGAVPLWFGIATIVREVLVSAMVLLLASLGAARIDVRRGGTG
jgi:cardiolipin synthase